MAHSTQVMPSELSHMSSFGFVFLNIGVIQVGLYHMVSRELQIASASQILSTSSAEEDHLLLTKELRTESQWLVWGHMIISEPITSQGNGILWLARPGLCGEVDVR